MDAVMRRANRFPVNRQCHRAGGHLFVSLTGSGLATLAAETGNGGETPPHSGVLFSRNGGPTWGRRRLGGAGSAECR
jgi:hypothetical protein